MKKIISALALTALLFGCNFGSGPAEPASTEPEDSTEVSETALNDNLFVALSAEILCLPANYPDVDADEIEELAKGVLADANVGEGSFSVYQQTIEADPDSKNSLSLAIVGKMSDFCQIVQSADASGQLAEDEEVVEDGTEEATTEGESTETPAE